MIPEAEALALWHKALEHPLGIVIRTDHVENLMARLYQVRHRTSDPDLYTVQIGVPKNRQELIIYPKTGPVNSKPLTEADLDSL
jgi:hypothetical protein